MELILSCLCCEAYEKCNMLDAEEYCYLKNFKPSQEFLLFVNDLVATLTEDGSSDEAEI